MKRLRVGHDWEIGFNQVRVVAFEGEDVVVRRLADDRWLAYGRYCPHQNADLQDAVVSGNLVRCPWHGLHFRLDDGQCLTNHCNALSVFSVMIENGEIYIYASKCLPASKQNYVARYGWDSRIGIFTNDLNDDLRIGGDYVAQTGRGEERVSIMSLSDKYKDPVVSGRIVRFLPLEDDLQNPSLDIAQTYLQSALDKLEMGHEVLHLEVLIDGNVIAHLLGEPARSLGPLAANASQALGHQVLFEFVKIGE